MAKSIEDIRASFEAVVGKIELERPTPGTRPGEADEVRYVSFDRAQNPSASDLFDKGIPWRAGPPPQVRSGAILLPGFIITIPEGTPFYALEYHGDVQAWQKQIEQGAAGLGLLTAKIESDRFVISDGRSYPLSDCKIELDIAAIT